MKLITHRLAAALIGLVLAGPALSDPTDSADSAESASTGAISSESTLIDAATFSIRTASGRTLHAGRTPAAVTLARSDLRRKRDAFLVDVQLGDGTRHAVRLESSMKGWYVSEQLVGGVVGMLIIDVQNNAVLTLTPDQLIADKATDRAQRNDTILVTLARDVDPALLAMAQRVDLQVRK